MKLYFLTLEISDASLKHSAATISGPCACIVGNLKMRVSLHHHHHHHHQGQKDVGRHLATPIEGELAGDGGQSCGFRDRGAGTIFKQLGQLLLFERTIFNLVIFVYN